MGLLYSRIPDFREKTTFQSVFIKLHKLYRSIFAGGRKRVPVRGSPTDKGFSLVLKGPKHWQYTKIESVAVMHRILSCLSNQFTSLTFSLALL